MSKEMTPAVRAKRIREMADSITVRNHLFSMVNSGRVEKSQRKSVLKFLDYIDNEVLQTCMQVMPLDVKPMKSVTNSDFVQAREKQVSERAETVKQGRKAAEAEKHSKGAFSRVE